MKKTTTQITVKKTIHVDWPQTVRAAPNCILRSALFGLVEPGTRTYQKRAVIASWKGTKIRYTGEQLDQSDLDVWFTWMHQAKSIQQDKDGLTEIKFTAYTFLKAMRKDFGTLNKKWLLNSVLRHGACIVEIDDGSGHKYGGSLLNEFYLDEKTGEYRVLLNTKLMNIFKGGFTYLDYSKRLALGDNQLAKWLMGYLHTQKPPHKISLEKIHELCGSSSEFKQFKFKIKKLLETKKSEYKGTKIVDNLLILM